MREYTIVRRPEPLDWARVPELRIDAAPWGLDAPVSAWAQICWDDEALHLRMRARERDVRAAHGRDEPLGMPCEDSCLEFFLAPEPGDARYFNIEFNPNGCMFLGFGGGRESLVRLLPQRPRFAPEARRTGDGWEICYRVPFDFLRGFFPGFRAEPGRELRANCYKCGDRTARPHYLCWNPCAGAEPDFHRPGDFGRMRLG